MLPSELPTELAAPTATTEAMPPTLVDVLALIAGDSDSAPAEYLDESVVPHGGE
jgi:hypothetical protein